MSKFSEQLMTYVDRLEYDFNDHFCSIYLPEGCCVDMSGATQMATDIDPECARIQTFAGGDPDTAYLIVGTMWKALPKPDDDILADDPNRGISY